MSSVLAPHFPSPDFHTSYRILFYLIVTLLLLKYRQKKCTSIQCVRHQRNSTVLAFSLKLLYSWLLPVKHSALEPSILSEHTSIFLEHRGASSWEFDVLPCFLFPSSLAKRIRALGYFFLSIWMSCSRASLYYEAPMPWFPWTLSLHPGT